MCTMEVARIFDPGISVQLTCTSAKGTCMPKQGGMWVAATSLCHTTVCHYFELLRQVHKLHIKTPALKPLIGVQLLRCRPREQLHVCPQVMPPLMRMDCTRQCSRPTSLHLESALRVLHLAQAHHGGHKNVEPMHQKIAQGAALCCGGFLHAWEGAAQPAQCWYKHACAGHMHSCTAEQDSAHLHVRSAAQHKTQTRGANHLCTVATGRRYSMVAAFWWQGGMPWRRTATGFWVGVTRAQSGWSTSLVANAASRRNGIRTTADVRQSVLQTL